MRNHLVIARTGRGYSVRACLDHSRTAAAARERAQRRGIHRHVDTAVGERSAALSVEHICGRHASGWTTINSRIKSDPVHV